MQLVFWGSLLFIFYAYFGYPLLLKLISVVRKKTVNKAEIIPSVTLIVAAHNEEARIKEKIENTLSLEYPGEKLQTIIASDASTDATDSIVLQYKNSGIELVRTDDRKGKENAQQHAINRAHGDILVFSDTATILKPDALRRITGNFSDPSVGCVSSVDQFVDEDGNLSGEGMYVRYEMYLRNLESSINSLVGLSGSFFAARKEVCENWKTNLQSDFNTVLNTIKIGMRGVLDPDSIGYYKNISDDRKEYERKARTVARGITVLMNNLNLLNPVRYGIFSWQLFSHKLCRWLVPFFLITAFVSNVFLLPYSVIYKLLFVLHAGFYGTALLFKGSGISWFRLPHYFLIVNKAILSAWLQYFRGTRYLYWTPSER